jgi:hypothetical protein
MNASSFGLRIVTAYLFNECFEYSLDNNSDSEDVDEEYLFSHIQHLNTSVTNTLFSLPTHLQCPDNIHDNDAIIVNLLLNTALICIYRVAMARPHIVMAAAPDIQDKGLPAAQTIVTIIAIVGDIDTRFRNPLVAFAAYVAASFFFDDFVANHDPQSEEKLMALLNLMIAVGKQNTFTASLAVQLAQALKTSGVDPDAVEKVRHCLCSFCILLISFRFGRWFRGIDISKISGEDGNGRIGSKCARSRAATRDQWPSAAVPFSWSARTPSGLVLTGIDPEVCFGLAWYGMFKERQ